MYTITQYHVLLNVVIINYVILFIWFCTFTFAKDWMYEMHSSWFEISREKFDAIHYGAMAVYKIGILLFYLTPLIALHLSR